MRSIAQAVGVLVCCATAGCTIAEPGTPPGEPSPLFDDYKSYATLDDLKDRLPNRSTWQIVTNSDIPPRASCPRFHDLAFIIPAEHLGHKGKVELRFINNRLMATIFTPQEFRSYLDALRRSGVSVSDQGDVKIRPATLISIPMAAPTAVMWQDERFGKQVQTYIGNCS